MTTEEKITYIKNFQESDWVRFINQVLVGNLTGLPISVRDALPEQIIAEVSSLLDQGKVDKSTFEDSIVLVLNSVIPTPENAYKLDALMNMIAVVRPVSYISTFKKFILERRFIGVVNNRRNLHFALLNFYRAIIIEEDFDITSHINSLIAEIKDGNLFLVAVRYHQKFAETEDKFNQYFGDIIEQTTDDKQRSLLLIFVDEWVSQKTYAVLVGFMETLIETASDHENTRAFAQILLRLLERIQPTTNDVHCLTSLNLCKVLLDKKVNYEEIRSIERVAVIDIKTSKGLVRLNQAAKKVAVLNAKTFFDRANKMVEQTNLFFKTYSINTKRGRDRAKFHSLSTYLEDSAEFETIHKKRDQILKKRKNHEPA